MTNIESKGHEPPKPGYDPAKEAGKSPADLTALADRLEGIAKRPNPACHPVVQQSIREVAAALRSQAGEGWVRFVDKEPPEGIEVDAFHPSWIDEDFCPDGVRVGTYYDSIFQSAAWYAQYDRYYSDDSNLPTHWRSRPDPPKYSSHIIWSDND